SIPSPERLSLGVAGSPMNAGIPSHQERSEAIAASSVKRPAPTATPPQGKPCPQQFGCRCHSRLHCRAQPCEDAAVDDGDAQIAIVRRRLGERVKSTLSGPSANGLVASCNNPSRGQGPARCSSSGGRYSARQLG